MDGNVSLYVCSLPETVMLLLLSGLLPPELKVTLNVLILNHLNVSQPKQPERTSTSSHSNTKAISNVKAWSLPVWKLLSCQDSTKQDSFLKKGETKQSNHMRFEPRKGLDWEGCLRMTQSRTSQLKDAKTVHRAAGVRWWFTVHVLTRLKISDLLLDKFNLTITVTSFQIFQIQQLTGVKHRSWTSVFWLKEQKYLLQPLNIDCFSVVDT